MSVALAFTLQPEARFLDLTEPLIREHCDAIEVAPETLWVPRGDAGTGVRFVPNGFYRRIHAFGRAAGKRFIAHGVGFSPGSAELDDSPRDALWLDAIARTHDEFAFEWYSDHLGAVVLDGADLVLPLPLPMDRESAATLRRRMAKVGAIVPRVALENAVFYFHLGDVRDEPAFLGSVTRDGGPRLVLDLHNLFTVARNAGLDPRTLLDGMPCEDVLEIHVSGGGESDPAWLDGRVMRLDSHEAAVPDAVFDLLDEALPRCANVAAVTLERMEGTVDEDDVPVLRDELARVRAALDRAAGGAP